MRTLRDIEGAEYKAPFKFREPVVVPDPKSYKEYIAEAKPAQYFVDKYKPKPAIAT